MHPIPCRLNTFLVMAVFITMGSLMYIGNSGGWTLRLVCAILFSFVFLTNYALMHEGSHSNLHPSRKWNQCLGLITGLHFPASFTLMRVTHIVHHCCNRTDHEMFDIYYKGDRVWVKVLQWYSILLGFFWLIIPIGSVLTALHHRFLLSQPFKKSRSSSVLFDDFGSKELWRVRLEIICVAAYHLSLVYILNIHLATWLLFYGLSAFNWSTRQYLSHAWSVRDVIQGAHNLKVSKLSQFIQLNSNWDLVHHNHPQTSWIYLPELGKSSRACIPSWPQYLSMWRGPRLSSEAAPQALSEMPKT